MQAMSKDARGSSGSQSVYDILESIVTEVILPTLKTLQLSTMFISGVNIADWIGVSQ